MWRTLFLSVTILFLLSFNLIVIAQIAVKVEGNVPWTDTGINIVQGQVLAIMAFGKYREGGDSTDFNKWIAPAGYPFKNKSSCNYPIPDARARGIIGKIANGSPFVVGDFKRMDIIENGRLYLGLNDINFSNNDGYCIVFLIKNPLLPTSVDSKAYQKAFNCCQTTQIPSIQGRKFATSLPLTS